jgi:hypothetical protein
MRRTTLIFSLDVRRARKGDCLLLHFGSKDEPGLVIIDGGPSGVYAPHLKPRLEQIRAARGLSREEPLGVDLLMISHVDDDHIRGILDLTKDMLVEKAAHRPLPLRVFDFWHNSFDSIIDNTPEELTAAFRSQFGAASTTGALPDDATIDADDEDLDEETIVASLKVLASIEQGFRLRGDAESLEFPPNLEFDGKLIMARQGGEALEIAPGLSFTVAGPMIAELEKLHKKHQAWLKDLKEKGKSPRAALAAYVDRSVPNLSSLVVLAEAGDRRMLFTGDARGDKILEGLELVGVLRPGGRIHVDVLKVPHHGSANNLDDDFFERITADHYVFSGDGEHGNPERDALQMLIDARGDADYRIHLTYPIEEIDVAREHDWKKEQAKEKNKKKKNPQIKVRPDWSPQEHGLTAFLGEHAELAEKVGIVDADKPHVIDLGEPLGKVWPSLAL